jgi:ATP-dependent Lhr-like helicase
VLRAAEETGRVRRGYFVESLGAAQFALPGAVDRIRGHAAQRREPTPAVVLTASDPANPYGAALPWPDRPARADGTDGVAGTDRMTGTVPAQLGRGGSSGHRPGRKAGALVVLVDGDLVLYVERGGRTLLSWTDRPELLEPAAAALAVTVRDGGLGRLAVERANGTSIHTSPLAEALEAAGFRATPRGLRLRG